MDDQASGFSKRKYETLNDKRRRMGDKKKQLKRNKTNAKRAHKMSKKVITKKKWISDWPDLLTLSIPELENQLIKPKLK